MQPLVWYGGCLGLLWLSQTHNWRVCPENDPANPQVVAPLLHERDMYLAWSLKRSKAVNGTRNVVGVIGKGHLRGVLYHLTHPQASGGLRCGPALAFLPNCLCSMDRSS